MIKYNTLSLKNKSHFFNFKTFFSIILITIIVLLISNPSKYINSCYSGLLTWAKNVLPSLFPFFICTKLLTELNAFDFLTQKLSKLMNKLFKTSPISSYVFIISIISGYPVGAKIISELYQSGQISSNEATKLTTFCSTSGPLFIVGTVGTAMLGNVTLGYIMLVAHIIGSILNGIIYRNCFTPKNNEPIKYITEDNPAEKKDYSKLLSTTMTNSILSVLVVGGFITIFYILIDMLFDVKVISLIGNIFNTILKPFNITAGESIASGIIEVTRGCLELSSTACSDLVKCVIATGLISFGGFSIHFQALTFLSQAKVNIKFYFLQKLTHTIISCILALIIGLIFNIL